MKKSVEVRERRARGKEEWGGSSGKEEREREGRGERIYFPNLEIYLVLTKHMLYVVIVMQ